MPPTPSHSKGRRKTPILRARLRVTVGDAIAIGPGKADVLQAVQDTGTLAFAARSLGMSYMRAWTLVRTLNVAFRRPLVELFRGGPSRGRAGLTPEGTAVLALYRRMEAESLRACAGTWRTLRRRLAP